ncbi:MAG: sarcosine oxidase subunit gamma [Paracoccaceae bacterium]
MPDLIAKPALGVAAVTLAGTTLAEEPQVRITSVAPWPGQSDEVGAALGLAFPKPNTVSRSDGARLVWAGREIAFLFDAAAPEGLPAAITDQSDGWVTLSLGGPCAVAVLARLVPLDLRAIEPGQAFRTALTHLPLLLIVEAPDSFSLLTFRSMAKTAWHEVQEAMEKVAARLALT